MVDTTYMNMFVRQSKCAMDMLDRQLFPNAKEITESLGMYFAMKKMLGDDFTNEVKNIFRQIICVGDGRTPRTASTFAFRSLWSCYSVDPMLKDKIWNVDRLYCFPQKIKEFKWQDNGLPTTIVCCHSHANIDDVLTSIKARNRSLIVMPCCVNQMPTKAPTPDFDYTDKAVWSPKNRILIWRNI